MNVANAAGQGSAVPPASAKSALAPLRMVLQTVWSGDGDKPGAGAPTGGQRLWRSLTRGALDLIYPPRCPLTGDDLADGPNPWLSAAALAALPVLQDPLCPRCSAPLGPDRQANAGRCRWCVSSSGQFQQALCLWEYEGLGRELVLAFKFGGERQLARLLGGWLYAAGRARDLFAGATWLAAAPASQVIGAAILQDDHAAALVDGMLAADRAAAQPLNLRRLAPPLRKIRTTAPQATLGLQDRLRGPADSMACAAQLDRAAVVLVDDVLTTLATASEATRALQAAGASEVRLLALARTL